MVLRFGPDPQSDKATLELVHIIGMRYSRALCLHQQWDRLVWAVTGVPLVRERVTSAGLVLIAGIVLAAVRRMSYHALCQLVPRLGFLVQTMDLTCTSSVRALAILRLAVLRISDADQAHLMEQLENLGVLQKVCIDLHAFR